MGIEIGSGGNEGEMDDKTAHMASKKLLPGGVQTGRSVTVLDRGTGPDA
jgi:hypothetical protein